MSVFSASVFDATVVVDGQELFKGRGAAQGWAEKVAKELETEVTVEKIGTGWALKATVDGEPRTWGIHGQRLSRIEQAG
ncbi:hypothetical protein LQ564_01895 [Massilia sp. G4R7]|uniref:Uncharacterized protein n=1 Tax=Massilia phyllostachyos TaxID=2898585 RepID=A0ABS8PZY9_9BURK|nr:hypothetical protein [Massilia phyllostachyos]MCD2515061.1 hypothetical protein [Massilia phyllostachyos]